MDIFFVFGKIHSPSLVEKLVDFVKKSEEAQETSLETDFINGCKSKGQNVYNMGWHPKTILKSNNLSSPRLDNKLNVRA